MYDVANPRRNHPGDPFRTFLHYPKQGYTQFHKQGMVAIGTYHIPLKAHKYPIGTYENLILVI